MVKKIRGLLLLLLIVPIAFCLVSCKKKQKNNGNVEPEIVTYQISYELFGGTNNAENPTSYTSGNEEITLLNPSRDYYNFVGWFDSENFENQVYSIAANSTENKTFYAKWEAEKYNINYVLNGGTNSDLNPSEYTVETEFEFVAPNFEAYIFGGWYYDVDFIMPVTKIELGSHGEKTLHAKWIDAYFNINYELNEGINNALNPTKYKYSNNIVELLKPTKIGYNFTGWYTDPELLHEFLYIAPRATGDIKVYAGWEAIKYEIEYKLDYGDNNKFNYDYYTVEFDQVKLHNPSKYGYDFVGWYTDGSLEEEYKITHIDTSLMRKVTVYAKWELKTIKITLDYDGATGNTETEYIEVKYNSEITEIPEPTKNGNVFMGWWRNNLEYKVGTIIQFNEDITVTAIWIPIEETVLYIVDFDSNGGSVVESITDITFATKIDKPTDPIKTGYSFVCWYFNEEKWDFENNQVISNMTLTAQWDIDTYTIEYVLNGGENPEIIQTEFTIETDDITLPTPTRDGFEFKGWFLDEGFTPEQKIEKIVHGSSDNIKVYASWQRTLFPKEKVTISVHFNLPEEFASLYLREGSSYSDYQTEIQSRGGTLTLTNFLAKTLSGEYLTTFGNYFLKYEYSFDYIDNSGAYAHASGDVEGNVYVPLSSYDTVINAVWNEEALLKYYYTDGLTFSVVESTEKVYVSNYTGSSDIVFIPEYYNLGGKEYLIDSIGAQAFYGNLFVTNVIFLPRSNTIEIKNSAFKNTQIESFDFTHVSKIYNSAFSGTALQNVIFSANVSYTEASIFENCKELVEVDLSSANEFYRYIYSRSFAGCEKLSTITLKNSIISIGEYAFDGCKNIKNINFISNTAENCSIGSRAFKNCTGLESVIVPNNIDNFGDDVFDGCTNITKITISKFYCVYNGCKFTDVYGLNNIKEIEISNDSTETTIPTKYFSELNELEKFVMGNKIEIINENAFKDCSALSNISLSNNLKLEYFKLSAFAGTAWISQMTDIVVIETTVVYIPSNASMEEVHIKSGVTAISTEACKDNTFIKKLYIPQSVEIISNSAFENCSNLEEVYFENESNLKQILNYAFRNCSSVSQFDLSNCINLEEIGENAFYSLGIDSDTYIGGETGFVLPNSLEIIGDGALSNAKILNFISNGNHFTIDSNGILYELDENMNKITIIVVPNNLEVSLFIVPSSVKKIHSYAFYYNYNISIVYIKSNIEIGNNAFDNATVLVKQNITPTYTYSNGLYFVLKELTQNYTYDEIVDGFYNVDVTEDVDEGYYYIDLGNVMLLINVTRVGTDLIVSRVFNITSYFDEM